MEASIHILVWVAAFFTACIIIKWLFKLSGVLFGHPIFHAPSMLLKFLMSSPQFQPLLSGLPTPPLLQQSHQSGQDKDAFRATTKVETLCVVNEVS